MDSNSTQTRLFIVEDDKTYGRMLKYVAEMNPDYEVFWYKTGKECLDNLHLKPSVISLDYSLPDMTGVEVLKRIKQYNQSIGIVIISGQQDVGTAVELLKAGAYDYIIKNEEIKERFLNTVRNLLQNQHLVSEVETLRVALSDKYTFGKMLKGASPPMQAVYTLLQKAATSNITVGITGETGTGKEVAAQSIHYNSDRQNGNFIAINMGAIPKELIESELFGHEKGAFTGAVTRKIGKFELADKGTLFLDEIGELDLFLQAKILRALQEREVTRVGGNKPVSFDARIIVATHRNLAEEVQKGNFRQDLYYRLLGLTIKMPPLRERGNDIILLAQTFADEYTAKNNLPPVLITREAKNKLLSYAFPGNVRELRAIVDLACVLCTGSIKAEDLQFHQQATLLRNDSEELTLREFTERIIFQYLDKYENDVITVANKLDIGKSTIYRLLKEKK
jgi:DNA-binding NtrC family response regulator